MKQGVISTGSRQLHYQTFGTGPQLLIAFHGYANNGSLFLSFEPFLGKDFTIVAIDLPHHGASKWPGNFPFTKTNLITLIKETLRIFKHEKAVIAGYSLGGRVCLTVLEQAPELVDKVLLIAPDGLRPNAFYYFLTRTLIGKKVFSSFLNNHKRYLPIIEGLRKLNILDPSRYKFVMHYVLTPEARAFLGKVWPDMRFLIPDIVLVKKNIAHYQIPVHIFMGRYDRVIPPKLVKNIARNNEYAKVHLMNKGHLLFDKDSLREMAGNLL